MKVVIPALVLVAVILGFGLILAHSSCTKPSVAFMTPEMAQSNKDPELYVAVQEAKKTLPEFIKRYQNPQQGDRGFGVQTAFPTPQGPEHIWVRLTSYANGLFTGRLANEPAAIPGKHKGDTVTVKAEDVTDWIYESKGKKVGGFTIDAIQKERG